MKPRRVLGATRNTPMYGKRHTEKVTIEHVHIRRSCGGESNGLRTGRKRLGRRGGQGVLINDVDPDTEMEGCLLDEVYETWAFVATGGSATSSSREGTKNTQASFGLVRRPIAKPDLKLLLALPFARNIQRPRRKKYMEEDIQEAVESEGEEEDCVGRRTRGQEARDAAILEKVASEKQAKGSHKRNIFQDIIDHYTKHTKTYEEMEINDVEGWEDEETDEEDFDEEEKRERQKEFINTAAKRYHGYVLEKVKDDDSDQGDCLVYENGVVEDVERVILEEGKKKSKKNLLVEKLAVVTAAANEAKIGNVGMPRGGGGSKKRKKTVIDDDDNDSENNSETRRPSFATTQKKPAKRAKLISTKINDVAENEVVPLVEEKNQADEKPEQQKQQEGQSGFLTQERVNWVLSFNHGRGGGSERRKSF